jgi:phosphate uptake regulator
MSDKPCTAKEKRFVIAYLETWNATKAAEAAGYKEPRLGYRVLQRQRIKDAISKGLDEAAMPANEVLARLGQHARVNIGDFIKIVNKVDKNGIPYQDYQLDLDMVKKYGYLIKELTWSRTGRPNIVLVDSQAALALLARHHGLLNDKTTNFEIDVSQLTNEQLERIANGEDPIRVMSGGQDLAESLFQQPVITGEDVNNGDASGPGAG